MDDFADDKCVRSGCAGTSGYEGPSLIRPASAMGTHTNAVDVAVSTSRDRGAILLPDQVCFFYYEY